MKAFLLLIALAAAPAAAADRRYTVTDFDRIQVEGPFAVVLKTGRPSSAVAHGSAHALDRVSMEVQGRLLKIKPSLEAWRTYPGEEVGPVTIEVGTHELRAAFVNGAGSLAIDAAKTMRFDLSLYGGGKIAIQKLEADTLNLGLVGSGKMVLTGTVKSIRASVQGSGDLDASALKAQDIELNAGTSGNITLAAERAAKIQSTSAGDVTIAGNAACTINARGSGRITCGH